MVDGKRSLEKKIFMKISPFSPYITRFSQALSILEKGEKFRFSLLVIANAFISIIEVGAIALLYMFFSIAMSTGNNETNLIVKYLIYFTDDSNKYSILSALSILITMVFIIRTIFILLVRWYYLSFIRNMTLRVTTSLFRGYVNANIQEHMKRKSSFIINNIWGNAKPIIVNCTAGIIEIFSSIVMLISISFVMIYNEPLITAIIGMFLGVISISYLLIIKSKLHRWGSLGIKLTEGVYETITESIRGIQSVKVFRLENYFENYFTQLVKKQTSVVRINTFISEAPRYFIEVLLVTSIMVAIFLSLKSGEDVSNILPSLVLFGSSAFRIIPALSKLMTSLQAFKFSIPAMDMVLPDYKYVSEGRMNANIHGDENTAKSTLNHKIIFKDISYSYGEGKYALNKINIEISKGDFIGFVGRSGSGKTTALNILLGLLTPTHGQVFVDNKKVQNPSTQLTRLFSFVPQTPFILNETFQNNITLTAATGKFDAQKFNTAIKESSLSKTLENLSDGAQTTIGEGNSNLSGGEAQRLCFARALYFDHQILALDEPTSSLDVHTEKNIISSLLKSYKDKTIVMIAHRLYTLKACNRIYFFNEGQIQASGSFLDLMENHSAFREMVKEMEITSHQMV